MLLLLPCFSSNNQHKYTSTIVEVNEILFFNPLKGSIVFYIGKLENAERKRKRKE